MITTLPFVSVSASRIVGLRGGRGSGTWWPDGVSVSASRIVGLRVCGQVVEDADYWCFSIRESDRWVESNLGVYDMTGNVVSVSASRIVGLRATTSRRRCRRTPVSVSASRIVGLRGFQ